MYKLMAVVASAALVLVAVEAAAQGAPPSLGAPAVGGTGQTITGKDASKKDAHDRPWGGIKVKTATAPGQGGGTGVPGPVPPDVNPTPPSEGEEIPPSEAPPGSPPAEDPPTFFGEPVEGSFAFLLDASGSMAWGNRIGTVRSETVAAISELTEDDEFDCVAYGSQFSAQNAYSVWLWEGLRPATETNKSSATSWINGPSLNPGGGTPTYACLQAACSLYPSSLDKMFLLTDGSPNISGSASQILADFPSWWSKFEDTELVAICIGGSGGAITFMQQLAALGGGTFISVP